MHPDERLDGPAARWAARVAEEVKALVVLVELAELRDLYRMLRLKRGSRR